MKTWPGVLQGSARARASDKATPSPALLVGPDLNCRVMKATASSLLSHPFLLTGILQGVAVFSIVNSFCYFSCNFYSGYFLPSFPLRFASLNVILLHLDFRFYLSL